MRDKKINRKYKDRLFKKIFESKEDVLSDILLRHKAEVTDMLLTEYDEELHINNEKDISYREGRIDGLAEGEEERKRLLEENERLQKEIEELKMKDAKYK